MYYVVAILTQKHPCNRKILPTPVFRQVNGKIKVKIMVEGASLLLFSRTFKCPARKIITPS